MRKFMRLAGVLPLLWLTGAAAPVAIPLPGDRLHPESVSIADGVAYVGSTGLGGVVRVRLKNGRAEPWIAPGTFGSGALFGVFADPVNRLLWTCTNDFSARGVTVPGSDAGSVVKAFDLRTGQGKVSLPMPGDKPVCNDFAVARDGSVYVTDTAHPRVLRWRPGAPALQVWLEDAALGAGPTGGGIDGIAVGGDGGVYVNNVRSGDLFRIAVAAGGPGKVTKLALSRPLGSPDGMRSLGGDRLLVADSRGTVSIVAVNGDRGEVTTVAENIHPTGVDADRGTAWYVEANLGWLFGGGKTGTAPTLPFRLSPVALPN